MVIYVSLLVAIIGLLIWQLWADAKKAEIGKIMFAAGLLAFLLRVAELPTIRSG